MTESAVVPRYGFGNSTMEEAPSDYLYQVRSAGVLFRQAGLHPTANYLSAIQVKWYVVGEYDVAGCGNHCSTPVLPSSTPPSETIVSLHLCRVHCEKQ